MMSGWPCGPFVASGHGGSSGCFMQPFPMLRSAVTNPSILPPLMSVIEASVPCGPP